MIPINGFVGYRAAGTNGTTATIIPMLALQGNLALPNGFLSSFTDLPDGRPDPAADRLGHHRTVRSPGRAA